MAIKSICYLGKEDEILFFYSTEESDEISSRFSIFAALNNVNKLVESSEKKQDPYLGYVGVNLSLFSANKNYAYVIKLINLKIILTIDDSRNKYTDDIIRSIFIKLHKIYADAVCNPFYTDRLEKDSLEKKIKKLIETS
ncbi:trafficking protein particle complex subunit 2-like protein [Plasmodium gonderi]|uniref:Trafficking protein particle complex subunit 2-like protein n=1 Tax=Plasmodium gonderi TaxID=77519 RepID=A0A1Y1JBX4_PLAGO|nr:trafficking protein particle complex subunit 2-like protein [Plasmodium gonderi]GAW79740.1 trafficking protein particle complex subunit 2-like protein [Plasmodium gonderi]